MGPNRHNPPKGRRQTVQASKSVTKGGSAGLPALKAPSMRAGLRQAIDEIVFKGRTQRAAAEIVGYNETSLGRALQRPDIALWVEHLKTQALMNADRLSKQARAIAINEGMRLMVESTSDQVRARMVEFFAREPSQPLVNIAFNQPPPQGYTYTRPAPASPTPDRVSGVEDAQVVDNAEQSDDA